MSAKPDEPLVMLVRALAAADDDAKRTAHANRLADVLAERLQGTADAIIGDRLWVDDCVKTLTRLLAHLAAQQVADHQQIDTINQALVIRQADQSPRLVNLQQFEHDLRTVMQELVGGTFNPLLDRIIDLQEQLKRAQQAIVILKERLGLTEGGDSP
mgnify:CR=1 FL=1